MRGIGLFIFLAVNVLLFRGVVLATWCDGDEDCGPCQECDTLVNSCDDLCKSCETCWNGSCLNNCGRDCWACTFSGCQDSEAMCGGSEYCSSGYCYANPTNTPAATNTPEPPTATPTDCIYQDTQCQSNDLYTCNANGDWVMSWPCNYDCNDGGSCDGGDTCCSDGECCPAGGIYCRNTCDRVVCSAPEYDVPCWNSYAEWWGGADPYTTTCLVLDNCGEPCHPIWSTCGGQVACTPPSVSQIDSCGGQDCGAACEPSNTPPPGGGGCGSVNCDCALNTCVGGICTGTDDCNNSYTCSGLKNCKSCAVSVLAGGTATTDAMQVGVSGWSNQSAADMLGLKIQKSDGGSLVGNTMVYGVGGGNYTVTGVAVDGRNYYQAAAADCTTDCGKTVNLYLPRGDYYAHCLLPDNTNSDKCTGNPACDYEAVITPSVSCSGWRSCSSEDNVHLTIRNPPSCRVALPTMLYSSGTGQSLTVQVSDADGATNIKRVYVGANNCTVDPGEGDWSNFERKMADYFGMYAQINTGQGAPIPTQASSFEVADNNNNASCTGGQGYQSPWLQPTPTPALSFNRNKTGSVVVNSVMVTDIGDTGYTVKVNADWASFPAGTLNYYCMVTDWDDYWGGTGWKKLGSVCVDNQVCNPECGQVTTCTTCSYDDTGSPGQVTPVSPRGSTTNPTPFNSNNNIGLNWTNGESDHAKTDIYQYHLTDLGGGASPTPTIAWVASSITGVLVNVGAQTSGHTYEWRARAVNNTCETIGVGQTYSGSWSGWGYFCYEAETCLLQCGQSRDCDGNGSCLNTENTVPGQVTPTSPVGSLADPTVLNDVTGAPLRWGINEANHAYTDKYNYQVLRNYGAGVTDYNSETLTESVGTTTAVGSLGRSYRWMVRARNDTCYEAPLVPTKPVIYGAGSDWGYYVLNKSPTLPVVTLGNEAGTVVAYEYYGVGETGNQICDQQFTNRRIRFTVGASDIGVSGGVVGGASVDSISLRLRRSGFDYVVASGDNLSSSPTYGLSGNGVSFYTTQSTQVVGDSRTVVFPIQFGDIGTEGILDIQLYAEDVYGANTGWVDSTRDLKIWDCVVPVSGTLYDSSQQGATACPNVGYSYLYGGSSFAALTYVGMGVPSVSMSVSQPTYQSPVGIGLSWGRGYIADINDDIDVANPEFGTRVVDMGNIGGGTTTCEATGTFTLNNSLVSAYSDSPSLQVDFSGIRDQEPWYQAVAGGINADGQIIDNVPATCYWDRLGGGSCREVMSLEAAGVGSSNNGLVIADDIDNNSGCGVLCDYGWPNNWSHTPGILRDKPGYDYFYNQYFVKYGEGTTFASSTDMETIVNLTGGTGVVLVNGDVVVNVANILDVGEFLMVVARGGITVDESVSGMQGIFVANRDIGITGQAANQMVVEGLLYSAGENVILTRSYLPKNLNNTSPAVVIEYRPDLIFTMPPNLARAGAESVWREGW